MLSTLGGVGMWSIVVVLPAVQADFGVDRADASLPYTLTMVGFVFGGTLMGWLADRFGIVAPVVGGSLALSLGYVLASRADSLLEFALIHGVLIGFLGSSATFGPVIAGVSLWFDRRRGIAVAIGASGAYMAGTVWPLAIQGVTDALGWRDAYFAIGIFCLVTMLPLVLALRRPPPLQPAVEVSPGGFTGETRPLGMRPNLLQGMLILAGISCCVAMAMPQVHIVALCADLGYGAQRGAEMLSLMLGFGIVSRLASGWIADRIGPLPTLLLGSVLQAVSLLLYMTSQSVGSLYVVSALFGLFQGGIVLSYALIVRQFFPAAQAGTRIGLVLSATLGGMAIGGWMSGAIYDLTLSYDAAFLNGFFWNLLNIAIALFLLVRGGPRRRTAPAMV
ncbi:MFS family permease [Constrictibacter sp. MBR-5]|jgi:MFS family permease|uniref:MFS transporter n=1 Tax=Constrictibacter sp. MBR-5 TaxID=3156467 RepID=UPI00339913B7